MFNDSAALRSVSITLNARDERPVSRPHVCLVNYHPQSVISVHRADWQIPE